MIPSRVFTVYCRVCNVFCCTIAGKQRYGEIEFTGTFFINEQDDEVGHYIGFVFAYQNNRQFYLVSWRQDNRNYLTTTYKAGIGSVQIKVNFYLFLFMRYKHWTQHNSNSPAESEMLWRVEIEMECIILRVSSYGYSTVLLPVKIIVVSV